MTDIATLRPGVLHRGAAALSEIHGIAGPLDAAGEAYAQSVYGAVVRTVREALPDDLRGEFDLFVPPTVSDAGTRRVAEQSLLSWVHTLLAQQSPAFVEASAHWGDRITLNRDAMALRIGESPF